MNVHHLELFYYVAKHGGISAAVRHMPYGIQQPAVSGQMGKLEEEAGMRLFERSPFRLTPSGQQLFEHIQPFFDNLPLLAGELRAESKPELRIGGSEIVLRDYLPVALQRVRARHPKMRLSLHSGNEVQVGAWVRDGEIELAITSLGARPPARLRQMRVVQIPLVLLVPKASRWKTAAELLARKKIAEPLVGQPAASSFMQAFQRELRRRRIVWPQTVEVTSVELVMRCVENGEGCGVVNTAAFSGARLKKTRALPLEGFEPMALGGLWRGELSPLAREVVDELHHWAKESFPEWACAEARVEPKAGPLTAAGGSAA